MSLSRNQGPDPQIRDIKGDYIKAYLVEYEACKQSGRDAHAALVAEELRKLGHEVAPTGAKERAVDAEPLEKAVEGDEAPKRRGRAKKAE